MLLSAGDSAGQTMPNHAHRRRHTDTARCVDGQKSRLVKNSIMMTMWLVAGGVQHNRGGQDAAC